MNRRGFLLASETLKIVIAVICIGFLIYFLVHLYFTNINQQKSGEAEASLRNKIIPEIQRVDGGAGYKPDGIHIPNPSGWRLMSFVGEEKKPNSCAGENCLCICRNVVLNILDKQIKTCDEKGACGVVSNLKDFTKIKIEKDGVGVLIKKINNWIEISEK